MEIFKKKPNPLCKMCKCRECEQNCNPDINDVPEREIAAANIMYEQFGGCTYGVKKKKEEETF